MPEPDSIDPFLGAPRLQETALAHEVRGTLVGARKRWLLAHFGEETLQRVADALEGDARRWLLEPPPGPRWYPMAVLAQVDAAMLADPMEGDLTRFRPFGEEIADYDLSSVYKMLFRLGTPSFVLRNLNAAYRTYTRPGTTRTEIESRGRASIELTDTVLPVYYCEHGIPGWIAMAVKKSGGEAVSVTQATCRHRGQERCVWNVSWT